MQLKKWRLLLHPPSQGSWNMAVDDALLEMTIQNNSLPILRCYAWEPPCLSLGYAQTASVVDIHRVQQLGWDVVRRPTGGQAILHTDELTYAVIGRQELPLLQGSVLESYQKIADILLTMLNKLGVQAESLPAENLPATKGPVCFEVPSHYEITYQGKKIWGSAQARRKGGVLQHGALPLHGDITRITRVLNFNSEAERIAAAEKVLKRAITVEQILGRQVEWEEAATALVDAFREKLGIEFEESDLTKEGYDLAQTLKKEKYNKVM
jgi:lipoate-protein ligase A